MRYHKDIANSIRHALPEEKKSRLSPEQVQGLKNTVEFALILAATPVAITIGDLGIDLLKAIERSFYNKTGQKLDRKQSITKTVRTVYYLRQKKYIHTKWSGDKINVILTKSGRKRMKKIEFENMTVPRVRRWDKKWWQVAADIPTKKHKRAADLFREKLKQMNFFPLQRTLWFYPYDPRTEVEETARRYQIGNFVTVMEISRLDREDERKMKKFFQSIQIL